jgi:hypothetical protein
VAVLCAQALSAPATTQASSGGNPIAAIGSALAQVAGLQQTAAASGVNFEAKRPLGRKLMVA